MKTATVIRHVHFEDLGAFAPVLERHDFKITYVDVGVGTLAAENNEPDLLVVLGGPIGAYEEEIYPFLVGELDLIRRRLAGDKPILGICLGAQLMARALGAKVYPSPAKEIGWAPLTLTDAGREGDLAGFDGVSVLHWHGDTFDLPVGAARLASTPICANQAFALGRRVLAFQFHPEATATGFERWLIGHACEIAAAPGVSVPQLRAQAESLAAKSAVLGQRCLEAWLRGLSVPNR